MALISPSDQQRLRESFGAMTGPVRLLFFTQTIGCDTCLQTRQILDELELPLITVLADMEACGVAIDRQALGDLGQTFGTEIQRLEEEIFASVGHQFTLGSPKQLEQVLFYELNLPRGRRTKTGFSTDASVLEDLRPAHPMVGMLLDWRLYTKLKSTYVDSLPALLDPTTGRLHTTFHQAIASTSVGSWEGMTTWPRSPLPGHEILVY